MNTQQYSVFNTFRQNFRTYCSSWDEHAEELAELQTQAALGDGVPLYPIETPVVYNTALDAISRDSDIRLIVVGDNPGKTEQLAGHRQYLVGQAGKIAEGFFRRNEELNIDFRKNVIILNKTPVHSAKTKELQLIVKKASPLLAQKIKESITWCAEQTARLHTALAAESPCMMWMVGYGELKSAGLFSGYTSTLAAAYKTQPPDITESVMVFQHFSMNRFLVDLKQLADPSLTLHANIEQIGRRHRKEILGF